MLAKTTLWKGTVQIDFLENLAITTVVRGVPTSMACVQKENATRYRAGASVDFMLPQFDPSPVNSSVGNTRFLSRAPYDWLSIIPRDRSDDRANWNMTNKNSRRHLSLSLDEHCFDYWMPNASSSIGKSHFKILRRVAAKVPTRALEFRIPRCPRRGEEISQGVYNYYWRIARRSQYYWTVREPYRRRTTSVSWTEIIYLKSSACKKKKKNEGHFEQLGTNYDTVLKPEIQIYTLGG